MNYLGDFIPGAILDFKFTTRSGSTGAPTTLAGSPALSVYKSNSTTQTTTGVTLSVDFDSVTGLNNCRIDTSADTTFYDHGSEFDIVITAGTVGGTTVVGETIGHLSLSRASVNFSAAGRLSGTHSTTTADLGTNAPASDISGQYLFFPTSRLSRVIDSYNTGTGVTTFSPAVAVAPANGDNWTLLPAPPASTASFPNVNVEQISGDGPAAIALESALDGTGGVTFSVTLGANAIPATALAADAITAAKIAPDAGVEIANAVLTAAVAAPIYCHVRAINGIPVNGGGTSGNLWRGP